MPAACADAGGGRRHHRLPGATRPGGAGAGAGGHRAGVDAAGRDRLARDLHGRRAELARDRGRLHHHRGLQLHPARAGAHAAALLRIHHRAAVQDAGRDGHPLEHRPAHDQGPGRRAGVADGIARCAAAGEWGGRQQAPEGWLAADRRER